MTALPAAELIDLHALQDRDYATEMHDLLESEDQGDPAPLVAARVVAKLRVTDPGLLAGWLDVQAVNLIAEAVRRLGQVGRSRARRDAPRSAFREFEDEVKSYRRDPDGGGDAGERPAPSWLATRWTVEGGRRPTLGEMTAPDLLFVAGQHTKTANEAKFEAAFAKALASKIGDDTVSDHFTDEQITNLRSSLI
jgi:hypothetical protein